MEDDLFFNDLHDDCDWLEGLHYDPNNEPTDEALQLIEAELFG